MVQFYQNLKQGMSKVETFGWDRGHRVDGTAMLLPPHGAASAAAIGREIRVACGTKRIPHRHICRWVQFKIVGKALY